MDNIFKASGTPRHRYTRQNKLGRGVLFLVWESILREAGFHVPVLLSLLIETRLEVPPEWQGRESFDARLTDVLAAARAAMRLAPGGTNPVTFTVVINDNTTDQPENVDLEILYDGFAMILDFACSDADSSVLAAAHTRPAPAQPR